MFAGPLISYRFPEIKAIEEGIFDEKRYSLETTFEWPGSGHMSHADLGLVMYVVVFI